MAAPDDEDGIVELEKLVWHTAQEATHEHFRWLTESNPWGQAIIFVMKDDTNRVVSLHIVVPLPALINGTRSRAGISVNVATHPDYRRQGLSRQLAHAACAQSRETGIDFLISVSSSMSHELFTVKQQFQDVGKPDLLVRWIDPGIFFRKNGFNNIGKTLSCLKNLASKVCPMKPNVHSGVQPIHSLQKMNLDGIVETAHFCLETKGPWIEWRYDRHPFRRYQCAIAGEPECPEAMVIYEVLEDYERALIMEFLVSRKASLKHVQSLFDYVARECELAGCSSVCCMGVPGTRKAHLLGRSGFWRFPLDSVWRPNIVVKSFHPLPEDFSLSSMDISYGALVNVG